MHSEIQIECDENTFCNFRFDFGGREQGLSQQIPKNERRWNGLSWTNTIGSKWWLIEG